MKKKVQVYLGSIVLGLNDALVELTGALAGLTLALPDTKIIAIAGLITGIAASMSMAASEYLSIQAEHNGKNSITAALYTGFAYILTVIFLIFPYFILTNVYYSLIWALVNAVIVIFTFTYTATKINKSSFAHKFFEMIIISFTVALISFGIGYFIRIFFGI